MSRNLKGKKKRKPFRRKVQESQRKPLSKEIVRRTNQAAPGSGAWTCLCGTARQPRMLTKRSGSPCLSVHGAVFFCCSPCSGFRAQLCQYSSHNARAGGRPSPAQLIPVRMRARICNVRRILAQFCLLPAFPVRRGLTLLLRRV